MARIAIDALPINNLSGRHVLLGHLRNLAEAGRGKHSYIVFHHSGNRDLVRDLGENVQWIECAGVTGSWLRRLLWQSMSMQRSLRRVGADLLLSTSGALVPGVSTPQLVLAQNPWCFFPQFHVRVTDRLKARLQRRGYKTAQLRAAAVFYLSDFMARVYGGNAGSAPRHGATVLVGIDDRMLHDADIDPPPTFEQRAMEVVTISAMTPHKSVEDVIQAIALLKGEGLDVRLSLVGSWSDKGYRAKIEQLVDQLGLSTVVTITGGVSNSDLIRHYRRARVFCLLSRCESFGIPSIEAQAFGTPAVVADTCAPPEIAGPGGVVVPPGRVDLAANALRVLLTDAVAWRQASALAFANAERFRWRRLSSPIMDFINRWPTDP